MANASRMIHPEGKKVYWVKGTRFYNDKNQRNGFQKAVNYCLEKGLNTQIIIQFDSDTECDYYEVLLERQNKGEIKDLQHHFLLMVLAEYTNANGDTIPAVTYNADFVYTDCKTGRKMVVDTKSSEYFLNNDGGRFILLKSLFDRVYLKQNIYIQIIIKKGSGFYEWHIGDKQKSGKKIKQQSAQIKALRKELHDKEIADRKAEREKAHLIKLRGLPKLTKAQRDRLAELEAKYTI